MRVLILTDSLGCPRSDVTVEKTWTDRVISQYKSDIIYTYCRHGLSTKDLDFVWIEELELDIILCQFGIVDACRRALSNRQLRIISKIPIISPFMRKLCGRYHYEFTKAHNIHYADVEAFEESCCRLKNLTKKILFINIAPPGDYIIKRVFNVGNDVEEYNSVLYKCRDSKCSVIDPYLGKSRETFLLESDGHHLNDLGQELVYLSVSKFLDSL